MARQCRSKVNMGRQAGPPPNEAGWQVDSGESGSHQIPQPIRLQLVMRRSKICFQNLCRVAVSVQNGTGRGRDTEISPGSLGTW